MKNVGFLVVLLTAFTSCKPHVEVVGIQPFGSFNPVYIDSVKQSIIDLYGFRVVVLPAKELPKSAFVYIKSPRYRADSLLAYMKRNRPDTIDVVLGLTNRDISTTKRNAFGNVLKPERKYIDWGVFGLGYCPGPCCVVSSFRLGKNKGDRFFERLKKICIHEVGHNLGLTHCESGKSCVMQDAVESMKTIDKEILGFCEICKDQID